MKLTWLLAATIGVYSLNQAADLPALIVQTGHADTVLSVAVSRDGRLLASGDGNASIKVWDLPSGRELRTLFAHTDATDSLAFSPDGKLLASGAHNGTTQPFYYNEVPTYTLHDFPVRLWDVATGRELRTLENHLEAVTALAFSPDGKTLASGDRDKKITFWDPATGQLRASFTDHGAVISIVFSPDGSTFASADQDATITLWDLRTFRELRTFHGISAAFSPSGKTFQYLGNDGSLQLLDLNTLSVQRVVQLQTDTTPLHLRLSVFALDGTAVAAVTSTNTTRIWDTATGREIRNTKEPIDGLRAITLSQNGSTLITGGGGLNDSFLNVWDVARGQNIFSLGSRLSEDTAISSSRDGTTLIVSTRSGTFSLFNVVSGALRTIAAPGNSAMSPNADIFAAGAPDGSVRLTNINTGIELGSFGQHSMAVAAIAFSPDGQFVASGGNCDDLVKIWSVQDKKELHVFGDDDYVGHPEFKGCNRMNDVMTIVFSQDNNFLVSGYADELTAVWDVARDSLLKTFKGYRYAYADLAFSPDGRTIAGPGWAGIQEQVIKVWDPVGSGDGRDFVGHTQHVNSVAFSPDGKILASASDDKTVILWDLASGQELHVLKGHLLPVRSVTFSRDGKTVLSCGEDGTVKLWRTADGKEIGTLILFRDGRWVVTDPDGRFDTADLEDMPYLHWVFPDDPMTPLPIEIFMRDYYEPRLLSRILNGEQLKEVRDLRSLNRVQPMVRLLNVAPTRGQQDVVDITVEATGAAHTYQVGAPPVKTAVHDLRILRNGQLVAYRDGVLAESGKAPFRQTFQVRLPAGDGAIHLTAYAFNDDRVKSNTASFDYLPRVPVRAPMRRAYVVTVGVNHHDNAAWDLHYAANDAMRMSDGVVRELMEQREYEDIVPIVLVSNDTGELATKAKLKAVIDRLSGRAADVSDIPNGTRLQAARPDDFVLLSFSGHGVDANGEFYLIPEDTGPGTDRSVTQVLLEHAIASSELAKWLRDVDGGNMAIVIDACQSAASVGAEFKPGPMGDSGLGQLAYEKGMRILAASQAEGSAAESALTQQGLLSYALVHDGLDHGKADYKPIDGKITLGEWLGYGVQRVPSLAKEVALGVVDNRGASRLGPSYSGNNSLQQPALFDFTKGHRDPVIASTLGRQ